MNILPKKSLLTIAVSLGLTFVAGSAFAGEEKCYDKNNKSIACPPTKVEYCHNIGGPRGLGANYDGLTSGACTAIGEELRERYGDLVAVNYFFGILIPPTSIPNEKALAAHIAHVDGPVVVKLPERFHDASELGPHISSNVDCIGVRVLPQPPEPGN